MIAFSIGSVYSFHNTWTWKFDIETSVVKKLGQLYVCMRIILIFTYSNDEQGLNHKFFAHN